MEIFFGALFIALLFTIVVSFGFRKEREWGALALFFLILFLPVWALALWIPATGPIFYGIAWVDIIFFALILTFLFTALSPLRKRNGTETDFNSFQVTGRSGETTASGYSAAFWAFIAFILVAIILGSTKTGY